MVYFKYEVKFLQLFLKNIFLGMGQKGWLFMFQENRKIKKTNIEYVLYDNPYFYKPMDEEKASEEEINLAAFLCMLYGQNGEKDHICLAQKNGNEFEQFFIRPSNFLYMHKLIGQEDLYASVNTFHNGIRREGRARQLNALYLDFDFYKIEKYKHKTPQEFTEVLNEEFKDFIPPSFYVTSGRGVYAYWLLNDTWATEKSKKLYKKIMESMVKKFKEYGADPCATDVTRVLRLPSTINSKSKIWEYGQVILPHSVNEELMEYAQNPFKYEMKEFTEILWAESKKTEKKTTVKKIKKEKNNKITLLFTIKNLYYTRAKDIEKIVEMRKGKKQEGNRELMLFLFKFYLLLNGEDVERVQEKVINLNKKFIDPLNEKELNEALGSADKNAKLYFNLKEKYNKDTDGDINKYLQKNGFYAYSNKKIIEILGITPDEMGELKTLINKEEKQKRNTENHRKAYIKKENKKNKIEKEKEEILKLKKEGYTNSEISKNLGISLASVKRRL